MPIYNFICKKCSFFETQMMSIDLFLVQRETKRLCPECKDGFLSQKIKSVNSEVEKDKERFIMEMQDDIRKTVEKIRSGDEKAISDIYGETANPHIR
jgi:hypothetical protein